MSKAERFRRQWAEEEARDALLAFALETNPTLADGDGDLKAHYRVHDSLMEQSWHRGRR